MAAPRLNLVIQSQADLFRLLRITLWAVPGLMAIIGTVYTLYEHSRHAGEPGWPWITIFGIAVLGVAGPLLSWLCLRWALGTAAAYLETQAQLARRAEQLAALNQLSFSANHSLDLGKTLATILEQTMQVLHAQAGMVFIQEEGKPGLRLEAYRGISLNMAIKESALSPGHCLCGQAVKTRQVLFARDVGKDPRCTSDLCICEGFRSVACSPLVVKDQLVGLLQLASPQVGNFSKDQSDFLAGVASQVSVSIENARLYDKVRAFNVELEQKINQRTSELEAARWALAEKARQLQRLLSESYRIQEDTQARIAHDMHDGVIQMIIGALYETQASRQALQDDPERAVESLAHAQQLLAEVETEIRRVIYDLHPPVLDMMGLVMALRRFALTYSITFGVECSVHVNGRPRRLAKEIEVSIYRILQSALQNVATHAQANQAQVRFEFGSECLDVRVEDDGVGFNPVATMATPGEHLGLIGMRERAESLGAQLSVLSKAGEGTQVRLQLQKPEYLD